MHLFGFDILGGNQRHTGSGDILAEHIPNGNGCRGNHSIDRLHDGKNRILGNIRGCPDGDHLGLSAGDPDGAGNGSLRAGQLLLRIVKAALAGVAGNFLACFPHLSR